MTYERLFADAGAVIGRAIDTMTILEFLLWVVIGVLVRAAMALGEVVAVAALNAIRRRKA